MFQLLEFVRWGIGNKKAQNEGLVRSLHAFSGRASGQPNPSLEVGPRIRTLKLEYVMMFIITWSHSASVPSHDQVGLTNTLASSEGHCRGLFPVPLVAPTAPTNRTVCGQIGER